LIKKSRFVNILKCDNAMIDKKKYEEFKDLVENEKNIKFLKLYLGHYRKKNFFNSPLMPIVLSAVFAILGTWLGAWLQDRANLELEQKKFEASLVIQMLEKAENHESAAKHLDFLVKAGFLSDEQGKIAALVDNPENIPSFGIVSSQLTDVTSYTTLAQNFLKDLGFYSGPVDGSENQELSDAVKKFQASTNQVPDGIMNIKTLDLIQDAHEKWQKKRQ